MNTDLKKGMKFTGKLMCAHKLLTKKRSVNHLFKKGQVETKRSVSVKHSSQCQTFLYTPKIELTSNLKLKHFCGCVVTVSIKMHNDDNVFLRYLNVKHAKNLTERFCIHFL